MKDLTVRNIAKACGGSFHGEREVLDREVTGVFTDSRKVTEGSLFVPLAGERADGHDYISQIFEKGALVTLTERAEAAAGLGNYILVSSCAEAIQQIAGFYRRAIGIPVVGITGSVGKTSAKEMVASVLAQKYRTLKTQGNFNNNLGLPLTVFRMTEEDEIAVLEMGISHFGEMTWLAETAEPDIMVITNIGTCHLENLKDRDGVFAAKTECLDYVKLTGTVILCGEDDKLLQIDDVHGKRPIFYGLSPRCRVYVKDQVSLGLKGTKCTICVDEEEFQVTVPLPGEHMVLNAAAAVAVGSVCGLTPDEIRAGIESVEPVGGRLRITETGTYTLIEDYYNANPMSMKAALRILNHAEGRKVAVLGDMGELGTKERELHYEVGTAAGELDLGLVLLAGPLSEEIGRGLRDAGSSAEILQFPDTEQLAEALPSHVREGDQILIKASRFMQFEKAADVLKQ